MKYYVVEISEGDTKIAGKAIYEFTSEKDAVASYHSKMGNAMKSNLYLSELIIVIDENGLVIKRDKYTNTISE